MMIVSKSPYLTAKPPFEEIECASLAEVMAVFTNDNRELVTQPTGLSSIEIKRAKSVLPLVFAARFKAPKKDKDHVTGVSAFMGLDYDGMTPDDVDAIHGALRGAEGRGVGWYTSYQHTNEKPRIRFVICLDREPTGNEYERCFHALQLLAGGRFDSACSDFTRGFYTWSRYEGRDEGGWDVDDGPAFSVDWLLSLAPAKSSPEKWAARGNDQPRNPAIELVPGKRILYRDDINATIARCKKLDTENANKAVQFLTKALNGECWGEDGDREPLASAAMYELGRDYLTNDPETSLDIAGSLAIFGQACREAQAKGSSITVEVLADKLWSKRNALGELRANPPSSSFIPLTEDGMAERLYRHVVGTLHYVAAWKSWLAYDSEIGCWVRSDADAYAFAGARHVVKALQKEGQALGDDGEGLVSFGRSCESFSKMSNIVSFARHDIRLRLDHEKLDNHPMLLNTPACVVDLATGKGTPHDPSYLITQVTNARFDPTAKCPTWLRTVDEVTGGDVETAKFLQRFFGYCLTGSVQEHELLLCVGTGRNGKGVLFRTLFTLLGSYATVCPLDMLTVKNNENHPQELANLHGKRLALIAETDREKKLASAKMKTLTGGDPISARRMNENAWTFMPGHKFVITGQHEPEAAGDDKALWARIRRVLFPVSFEGRENRNLESQLLNELSGILNWCIEGCLEWQRLGGTKPSPAVVEATEEYRQDNDLIQAFLDECCVVRAKAAVKRTDAYNAFTAWHDRTLGGFPPKQKNFTARLKLKPGIKAPEQKVGEDRVFTGFELKMAPSARKFGEN